MDYDKIKDKISDIILHPCYDKNAPFIIQGALWCKISEFLPYGIWVSESLYVWGGMYFTNIEV